MKPIVIDLEASGLSEESYPIEAGIVLENGESFSWLIKREPNWEHWNLDSEKIHNISREKLSNEGLSALEVANHLNKILSGKIAYSDARSHDEFWINVLFKTVGIEREFEVGSIQNLFIHKFQYSHFYNIRNDLYKKTIRHRAENDAIVIQEAYCLSYKKVENIKS